MTTSTATTLANVVACPPSGRPKAVVFDHHEYAASVILRGRPVPWDNATAYAAFFAQAQGLLRPDVALLDLNRLYGHLTTGNTGLESGMAARSRTGFALRTLLGDDDLNRAVLDFVTVFTKTARQPVVLRIPSPMAWLTGTHHFSGADGTTDLDADNAENASMYVSDWLRAFAALPVAGLLLDNRTAAGASRGVHVPLEAYTPIANLASNYRWTLGQLDDDQARLHGDTAVGAYIPAGFWLETGVELPAGDFYLGDIPSAASPEGVLARLETLG
ncbi:hypothetical protein QK292_04875 [Arthrobacter sp. AL08]|uniref:hypothetical protein n=1 Tax=unclassified Arthrobacter TaxID=235627 RepID=UPI00249C4A61|nr:MULTISPECIES: hypothetical protein [unclassified Arthrobacter]MDI3241114.1 hypothetical protein [Arthrobacter sp. AL05]MDI3276910.1 hypothetical protein [Arthrobacter sp. AL08]